jgi:hypothetical protein
VGVALNRIGRIVRAMTNRKMVRAPPVGSALLYRRFGKREAHVYEAAILGRVLENVTSAREIAAVGVDGSVRPRAL